MIEYNGEYIDCDKSINIDNRLFHVLPDEIVVNTIKYGKGWNEEFDRNYVPELGKKIEIYLGDLVN